MALIDDIVSGLGFGGSTATNLSSLAGGALSGLGLQQAIENIQGLRGDISQQYSDIATRGGQATAFQPFTVTTGAGTAQFGPQGGLTLTPEQQALSTGLQQQAAGMVGGLGAAAPQFGQVSQQALTQALGALQQPTPTAQSLFGQLQTMQAPEQERQRLALENRLAAQGRLGTQTAAYGGTPEALALEKAIQEQQAANAFTAQQLAPQLAQQQLAQATGLFGLGAQAAGQPAALQGSQIANIAGLLSAAGVPQTQLIQALSPALQAAQLAQTGRASEAQLLGALGPSLLESLYKTGETEATLQQQQINALLQGLGIANQQPAQAPVFNIGAPDITLPEITLNPADVSVTTPDITFNPTINTPVTVG